MEIKKKPSKKIVVRVKTVGDRLREVPAVADDLVKMKFIRVREDIAKVRWNKALPVPLKSKEIVKVVERANTPGFIVVMHGESRSVASIFSIHNFEKLTGGKIWWREPIEYKKKILEVEKLKKQLTETPWLITGSRNRYTKIEEE